MPEAPVARDAAPAPDEKAGRRRLELADEPASPPLDSLVEELRLPEEGSTWSDEAVLVLAAGVRMGVGVLTDADGGETSYRRGDRILVEVTPGELVATEVVIASRRVLREPGGARVLRRLGDDVDATEAEGELRRREVALEERARAEARTLALPLRVVRAESVPGGGKVLLYFAADEKIVFREWLRALVQTPEVQALGARLELRQVGLRDAARRVGGVGPCGLTLCCHTFLADFPPTNVRMAQGQGLGTSPARIAGACGKILCCLAYEESLYRAQRARLPTIGETIHTPRGPGVVEAVDVLGGRVRVACEHGDEVFSVDAIERHEGAPGSIRPSR